MLSLWTFLFRQYKEGRAALFRLGLFALLLASMCWSACASTTWGPINGDEANCNAWGSPNHEDLANALKSRSGTTGGPSGWSRLEPPDKVVGCLVVSRTPANNEPSATEYKLVQLTNLGQIYPWSEASGSFENKPIKLPNLSHAATYRFQLYAFRHPIMKIATDENLRSPGDDTPEALLTRIEKEFCRDVNAESYREALKTKESWALFVLEFQPSGGNENTKLASYSIADLPIIRFPKAPLPPEKQPQCALYKHALPKVDPPEVPTEITQEPTTPDAAEVTPEAQPELPPESRPEPQPEPPEVKPEMPPTGQCFPSCSFVAPNSPKRISTFTGIHIAASPQGDYFSTCDSSHCKLFAYDPNQQTYIERKDVFPTGRGGSFPQSSWAINQEYLLYFDDKELSAWKINPTTQKISTFFTPALQNTHIIHARFSHDAKRLYAVSQDKKAYVWKFPIAGSPTSHIKMDLGTISLETPSGFAVHPKENMFAVGVKNARKSDGQAFWHINLYKEETTGKYIKTEVLVNKTDPNTQVQALAFHPSGKYLIISAEIIGGPIYTIDIPVSYAPTGSPKGRLLEVSSGSPARLANAIVFSRNGELMLTVEGSSNGKSVRIWEPNPNSIGSPYTTIGFFPNGGSPTASWLGVAFGKNCRDIISLQNNTVDPVQLWTCR